MLSATLTSTGIPFLVSTLSKIFKQSKNTVLSNAGVVLEEVSDVLQKGKISEEEQKEAHRHLEEMLKIEQENQSKQLSEINQSLRAEVSSDDPYVRRMRPTFGYIMALTWMAQMLAVAYVMVFETANAGLLIEAIGALSPIWGVGLSVLGIYVYKRSEDKKVYKETLDKT
ncbi:MAG: ribokinase [Micavibrio sp.]|nr:ribokinase [Micavibrio sp.]|tara:strand:+ start:528 stop:1037 length:510 start_codon:yes stop_codon:yes gene_type:complete